MESVIVRADAIENNNNNNITIFMWKVLNQQENNEQL